MPIVINGLGTITGITTGGLPDDCIVTDDIAAGAVTDAKIAAGAVTDAKITGAITDAKLSGTTCKAWVNFDGTAVVSPGSMTGVNASYNVSSVTDNGVGNYTITFTTAMQDANYCIVATTRAANSGTINTVIGITGTTTASEFTLLKENAGGQDSDGTVVCAAIFR